MSVDKLAKRYAKALFEDTISKGNIESVHTDMVLIYKTIESSKELSTFLKSPIIQPSKKKAVLSKIWEGKISKESFSLIQLMTEKGREGYLEEVAQFFNAIYNDQHGILEVKVTTAVQMDKPTEEKIKNVIFSKVGQKKLILHSVVDPQIMGGFIVDLGNKIYDASVRNKLSNIANKLIYN